MDITNPYALVILASSLAGLALGFYVLWKNPKGKGNRTFFLAAISIVVWTFGRGMVFAVEYDPNDVQAGRSAAQFWIAILWSGAVFIPPTGLHFISATTAVIPKKNMKYLFPFYGISPVIFYFLAREDVVWRWYGWDLVYGVPFLLYGAFIVGCLGTGFVLLVHRYRKSKVYLEKQEAKYLSMGVIIAVVFGGTIDMIFPLAGVAFPPVGGIATMLMASFFAFAILKYKLFSVEAVLETSKSPIEKEHIVKPGFSYLVKDNNAQNSMEIFRSMVTETPGLCITPHFPQKLRDRYNLEKTPLLWLTETATEEKALNPWRLEFEILYSISSFINENEKTIILIEDMGYLVLTNGLQKTMEFMKVVNDTASMHGSTVIGAIDMEVLAENEMPRMESIFDRILDFQSEKTLNEGMDMEIRPSYSYLIEESKPEKSYEFFKKASSDRKGLVITSTMPKKILEEYGLQGTKSYWLTNTTQAEEKLRPDRLDFELTYVIKQFLSENQGGVMIIDGMLPIVDANGMENVLNFIKSISDMAAVNGASIIMPIDARPFKRDVYTVLQQRFDYVVRPKER